MKVVRQCADCPMVTLGVNEAHSTPPHAEGGVTIGLADALCLADSSTNGNLASIQRAIRYDEAQRLDHWLADQRESTHREKLLLQMALPIDKKC